MAAEEAKPVKKVVEFCKQRNLFLRNRSFEKENEELKSQIENFLKLRK